MCLLRYLKVFTNTDFMSNIVCKCPGVLLFNISSDTPTPNKPTCVRSNQFSTLSTGAAPTQGWELAMECWIVLIGLLCSAIVTTWSPKCFEHGRQARSKDATIAQPWPETTVVIRRIYVFALLSPETQTETLDSFKLFHFLIHSRNVFSPCGTVRLILCSYLLLNKDCTKVIT